MQHVPDGQAAIDYLSGHGAFSDRARFPLPAAVLLDLKMPRKNGFEVLEWLRTEQQFRDLPILVLTSSEQPADQSRASELGASAYLTKSLDWNHVLDRLQEVLQQ